MPDVKDYPPYLDYPKERKKQTNADRLRGMNDEDLAAWLATAIARHYDQEAAIPEFDNGLWLDWLKQEVESDA